MLFYLVKYRKIFSDFRQINDRVTLINEKSSGGEQLFSNRIIAILLPL